MIEGAYNLNVMRALQGTPSSGQGTPPLQPGGGGQETPGLGQMQQIVQIIAQALQQLLALVQKDQGGGMSDADKQQTRDVVASVGGGRLMQERQGMGS